MAVLVRGLDPLELALLVQHVHALGALLREGYDVVAHLLFSARIRNFVGHVLQGTVVRFALLTGHFELLAIGFIAGLAYRHWHDVLLSLRGGRTHAVNQDTRQPVLQLGPYGRISFIQRGGPHLPGHYERPFRLAPRPGGFKLHVHTRGRQLSTLPLETSRHHRSCDAHSKTKT